MNLCKKILIYAVGTLCLTFSFSASAASVDLEQLDKITLADIIFKRILIETIDSAQDVNAALGFDDSSITSRVIAVPAWFLTAQAVGNVMGGLGGDIEWLTPDKRLKAQKVFAEAAETVGPLVSAEHDVADAKNKLENLREHAANVRETDENVRRVKSEIDQLKTEQASLQESLKNSKVDKSDIKTRLTQVAQSLDQAETKLAKAKVEAYAPHVEPIRAAERRLSYLTKEKNNFLTKFKGYFSRFKSRGLFYSAGRLIRGVSFTVLGVGFLYAQVFLLGDAVFIILDRQEDMELIKQSFIRDIEQTLQEAAASQTQS